MPVDDKPLYYVFSYGDRVMLVTDHPDSSERLIRGFTGTVAHAPDIDGGRVGVLWDDFAEGHNLSGRLTRKGTERSGWYVDSSDIIPAPQTTDDSDDGADFCSDDDFMGLILG